MKNRRQIENIFSKSKKQSQKQEVCPNPNNPIIIDTREKQSLVPTFLTKSKANVKFEKLEIADYLINNIAIERKNFADFISSMINKRLFQQLAEIKKYPKYFLVIENKKELENKNLDSATIGMILSIITDYEIPILFTNDEKDTAKMILLLAKKFERPKVELSLRPSRSNQTNKQQKQFILEGFPGIGPSLAKRLIEKFKSLNEIFNASEEELKEIKGFDKNKIEKFKQLLTY